MLTSTSVGSSDHRDAKHRSLADVVTREIVRVAVDLLVRRYGLNDPQRGLQILRKVSRIGREEVGALAAQLVVREADQCSTAAPMRAIIPAQPNITFGRPGWSSELCRIALLDELICATNVLAGTQHAIAHTVDPVSGGLVIDGQVNSHPRFLDYFSYIGSAETTYWSALANAKGIALDTIADIDRSEQFRDKIVTEVSPAEQFWQAEAEHQDYLQK